MKDIGGVGAGIGLSNLFQNKLFLQYLSGAGGAISARQPAGPALDKITQQNISSQNYMKLLKQILEGGGDIKLGKDKTSINAPATMFGGVGSELGSVAPPSYANPEGNAMAKEGAQLPGGSGINWGNVLNPSASSAIGGADLAGLTPENITQALQFKFTQESMENKKMTDLVDMIYKSALTDQAFATAEKARRPETLDEQFIGGMTLRQFKSLPSKDQSYALFVETSKKLGDTDIMSQHEYEMLEPTEKERFLKAAMRDPKLMDAAKELAKAGKTEINIGEQTAKAGALADVKTQKYFTDPKGLVQDIDKHINSEEVQRKLFTYATDPRRREIETIRAKEKFIVSKITASGGKIVDQILDGRTFVFTVKWPDKTTSEVRYAN